MTYTRGDNFQAFDGEPLTIEIATDEPITKALVVFNKGDLVKTYLNPSNVIKVYISEIDSRRLRSTNVVELIVFDSQNRKVTCEGRLNFTLNKEVYGAS